MKLITEIAEDIKYIKEDKEGGGSYYYILTNPTKKGQYVYKEYTFEYEPFYVGKGTKFGLQYRQSY